MPLLLLEKGREPTDGVLGFQLLVGENESRHMVYLVLFIKEEIKTESVTTACAKEDDCCQLQQILIRKVRGKRKMRRCWTLWDEKRAGKK